MQYGWFEEGLNTIIKNNTSMEEFDKYKELKYVALWFGVPIATITFLKYFDIKDPIIVALSIVIAVLLVSNYLKDKEISHLKNQIKSPKEVSVEDVRRVMIEQGKKDAKNKKE